MKRTTNSHPLSVAVQHQALSTSMHIVPRSGMALGQFYSQQHLLWTPDHGKSAEYDASGAQVDGTLWLDAEWSVADPGGELDASNLSPTAYWYVDGVQVTSADTTADYYLSGTSLAVRRNFTHLEGATVTCQLRFTDPRTSEAFTLGDSVTLYATLAEEEQWRLSAYAVLGMRYNPLNTASTQRQFKAQAWLGENDKTSEVAFFWDYKEDGGEWTEFTDDDAFYVSGKNSDTLTVDMDCIEDITVRVRMAEGADAAEPTLAVSAECATAWTMPRITAQVYCLGGDKVLPDTEKMTFGVMAHVKGRGDLTEDEQREWLVNDWRRRPQGENSPTSLNSAGHTVAVDADELRHSDKTVVESQTCVRGAYAPLLDSSGAVLTTSDGSVILART